MAMTTGDNKGGVAGINVVPLIDILLVLIIIFMVISPVISMGLPTVVPQPAKGAEVGSAVVIQVSKDGEVRINRDEVSWDSLGLRVDQIFKSRAEKIAFVEGDDLVDFDRVARAIDILRAHGVEHVGLITAPLKGA